VTVRAFALNTKTRAIVSEIPFSSLSVTNRLNDAGTWSMDVPVSYASPNGTEIFTPENFDVNFSSVVVLRDSLPIMYGLVESEEGELDENEEKLSLGGCDYGLGILKRRLYLAATAFNTDQFTIATSLINQAMVFGTTINIIKEPTLSGVVRQRTYYPGQRKYIYELLSELAAVENGFDYCAHVAGTQATGFTPGITLGYPKLERVTGFTLATGKNISRVRYSKDGKQFANFVQVGGADKSDYTIPVTAADASTLGTYVQFDRTESRPTVVEQATLLDHANRYLRLTTPQGVVEYEFVVDTSDPDCQVGSFRPGDQFQVRVNKGRLDLDTLMRVTEWTFSVDENGSENLTMRMVQTGLLS
jgi:hypothetical protein